MVHCGLNRIASRTGWLRKTNEQHLNYSDHESKTELEDAVGLEEATHKIGDTEARCFSKPSMNSFSTPVIITKNPSHHLNREPSEDQAFTTFTSFNMRKEIDRLWTAIETLTKNSGNQEQVFKLLLDEREKKEDLIRVISRLKEENTELRLELLNTREKMKILDQNTKQGYIIHEKWTHSRNIQRSNVTHILFFQITPEVRQ